MSILLAALLVLGDAPTATAMADARTIAENGMLVTIGRMQTRAEIESLVADHPELTTEEQATLRALGAQAAADLESRGIEAEVAAYSAHLSAENLAAIAAFAASEPARAQRAAMPKIMAETVAALSAAGPIDYKGAVLAQFCETTRKLCEN